MDDWSSWIQDVGKSTINTVMEAKYKQPFELQRMQLAQMGPFGVPYIEGAANAPRNAAPAVAGIPQSWLLIGAVIAAVVLLGD